MTEQVETLFKHIRDYYRQLAAYYQSMAEKNAQNERASLIFSHLHDYELKRANMLEVQVNEHPVNSDILKTWLKEKPHEPNSKLHMDFDETLPKASADSTDDIMAHVTKQHNQIADLYQQLADMSHPESMQELFGTLAHNEKSELKHLVNGMHEFDTM